MDHASEAHWSWALFIAIVLAVAPARAAVSECAPAPDPDLNDDGIVSLTDLYVVTSRYGLSDEAPGFDELADVNCDGTVNITDVVFVQSSMGQYCMGESCTRGTSWYQTNSTLEELFVEDEGDEWGTERHFSASPKYTDTQVLDVLNSCRIRRLYGSYGDRPVSEPAKIKAWNTFLHSENRISHLLLSDPVDGLYLADEAFLQTLLTKIGDRLAFHSEASPDERFDAVHLDIEPERDIVCKKWKNGDVNPDKDREKCYDLMVKLLEVVQSVRAYLNPEVKLYAALWHDLDEIGENERVAWPSAQDRDAWYLDLAAAVDGVRVMSYGSEGTVEATVDAVVTKTEDEWTYMNAQTEVRVATRTEDYGAYGDLTQLATAVTQLATAADLLENTSQNFGVDLHDFNEIFAGGGCL